ncbi:hypothetical protein ASL20_09745 [Cupriavidus necator]|nr:hypothetical protein ASL20_09745 [Cupriavidus necator]
MPYARNARQHAPTQIQQIAASILEFGWTLPVLADVEGVVAGHARALAAESIYEAGERIRLPNGDLIPDGTVPTLDCTGWTAAQRRAYILADNRLAEVATWDYALLSEELSALLDVGFDVDLLGFDADAFGSMQPDDVVAGLTDPDEAPAAPENPVCRPGDVWFMADHRLLCGDCLCHAHMALLMDGDRADLILTNPPYNVAYEGKTADRLHIRNDAMRGDAFKQFLLAAYRGMATAAKPGAGVYVFHSDTEGLAFRDTFTASGLKLAQCCIWVKQAFVLGRHDYHWQHEPVLYGWKAGAAHQWHGDRSQSTVWQFDRPSRNAEHPTMKPVALLEYLVANSSKSGDVVLDPFAGSGSTIIACEQTGRRARAMEIDPRYCDVIIRRWIAFTGKDARLADGRSFAETVEARGTCQAEPMQDRTTAKQPSLVGRLKQWLGRRTRLK